MKIVLQGFEPQTVPTATNALANSGTTAANVSRKKARLRLTPVAAETRLFHAL